MAYSGAKTGRSPKDKRVVKNAASEKDIWWGPVNVPMDQATFAINHQRAIDYCLLGDDRYEGYCLLGVVRDVANFRLSTDDGLAFCDRAGYRTRYRTLTA